MKPCLEAGCACPRAFFFGLFYGHKEGWVQEKFERGQRERVCVCGGLFSGVLLLCSLV